MVAEFETLKTEPEALVLTGISVQKGDAIVLKFRVETSYKLFFDFKIKF